MSQHTPSSGRREINRRRLPMGRSGLLAFEVAVELVHLLAGMQLPRGTSHLRDHLTRAADNTVLRISEACGRTMGNRRQHIEAAYAENQEAQSCLVLLAARGMSVPDVVFELADRLGGLIYGLLRAEKQGRQT